MKTNTAQQNIPSGWSVRTLNDLVLIKKGEQLNRLAMDDSGKYPALNGGVSPSGYTDKWNTESNTITISEGGNSCGFVNFNTEKFWCGGHCYALLNINNNLDINFLYQFLKSKQDQIMKLRVGSGLPNIQKRSIEEFSVIFPESKDEQQKIAEILGAVDEDIAKTQEVIKMTEKLKRGLMQQLFTRGIGHAKFKKTKLGEIPDEWEVIQMGELFGSIIGGGTPSRKEAKYWNGNIPWMTVKDMSDKKYVYDTEEYITATGLNESSSSLIPENNLITSTRMGIGRVYINKVPVAINQDLKGLIVKDDFILDYVYWLILSVAKKLEMKGTGSTVKGIRLEDFRSLDLALTRNKQEQKKISEILSAVDEKISINKKIKEKLAFLKKGLMQDLLSGRVRVKYEF